MKALIQSCLDVSRNKRFQWQQVLRGRVPKIHPFCHTTGGWADILLLFLNPFCLRRICLSKPRRERGEEMDPLGACLNFPFLSFLPFTFYKAVFLGELHEDQALSTSAFFFISSSWLFLVKSWNCSRKAVQHFKENDCSKSAWHKTKQKPLTTKIYVWDSDGI